MDDQTCIEENIDDEELKLAEKLRECCTPWGVERQPKLINSAQILLDMGKLYFKKARKSSGMLQKLTFIKCAALTAGARVRYEKYIDDKVKVEESTRVFSDMCSYLLIASAASKPHIDLWNISRKTGWILQEMRKKEKWCIERELKPFPNDLAGSKLAEKQKQKIKTVKRLLKASTSNYKTMMKDISKECVKILGAPPCKFALVGLGSLARNEVTLYSDFEHVIILDNAFDDYEDSAKKKIREYFRWYSVIFQVIIIGIGETFIPTVGVKSLNDLYSWNELKEEDRNQKASGKKNWFFDLYTPGGVSFDGRFPHSCKSPLGKQEASKNHKAVVELIQPVDGMINYLKVQKSRKNDYHLSDVLTRTCFVHGCEKVYGEFETEKCQILSQTCSEDTLVSQAENIVNNSNVFLSQSNIRFANYEKMKDVFYRPVSVLVSCMSICCGNIAQSNFDYFSWLRDRRPSIDLHDLEYALAVACEIRVKVYSLAETQKQRTSLMDVCTLISKHCATACFKAINKGVHVFHGFWEERGGLNNFFRLLEGMYQKTEFESKLDALLLNLFGFPEEALADHQEKSAIAYFAAGIKNIERKDQYFAQAEQILAVQEELDEPSFDYIHIMSQIHFHKERYRKGFDLVEKWTLRRRTEMKECQEPFDKDERYTSLQHSKSVHILKLMTPCDAVRYARNEIAESTDEMSQVAFRMTLANAHLQLNEKNEARLVLQDAVSVCSSNVSVDQLPWKIPSATSIMITQIVQGWENDATGTLAALTIMEQTNESPNFKKEFQSAISDGLSDIIVDFSHLPAGHPRSDILFKKLTRWLSSYCKDIVNERYVKIGSDLMSLFCKFSEHLKHPFFAGIMHTLTVFVVIKSKPLKFTVERSATLLHSTSMENDEITRSCFNLALQRYAALDARVSAMSFWWIVNSTTSTATTLKDESCTLLIHLITFSAFSELLWSLKSLRQNAITDRCFVADDERRIRYNTAIKSYFNFDFIATAVEFWSTIVTSHQGSNLQKRSIEMLMLSIVAKWDMVGFYATVGDNFISNEKTKTLKPAHARVPDLHYALLAGAEETKRALLNAGIDV